MKVSFQLTMPNVGSWNGKWTGSSKKYYVIRGYGRTKAYKESMDAIANKSFYYDFGDGWSASISVQLIDDSEARKREKISSGFCGYEWMIQEILQHGRILTRQERYEIQGKKQSAIQG